MEKILTGPVAVLRALGMLAARPRLVALALIPSLVAFAVSVATVWAVIAYGEDLFGALVTPPEDGGWRFVWEIGSLLTVIASVVGALIVVPWLVMLVGFPLCDPLVARADIDLGGPADTGLGLIGEILLTLRSTLGIVALGLAGAVLFFLLGLIPGVGLVVAPFVAFVWTPLFVAFDLLDTPLARRRFGFRAKLAFLRRHLPAALSLGLVASPLIAVPFLNLLGLPVAVVAGVIAVHQLERGAITTPTP